MRDFLAAPFMGVIMVCSQITYWITGKVVLIAIISEEDANDILDD